MDIRIHEPQADEAERAAVDSVLGPPQELWGHAARSKRDLLLPALHAVQDRFGWLTPGALNYISERLTVPPAELFGVATFYHLFSMTPQPSRVVHVCDDIACRISGAEKLCAGMETAGAAWKRSPCLGQCERAPATLVIEAGERPRAFPVGALYERPGGHRPPLQGEGLRLLRRIGRVDPESLDSYRANAGYRALSRAVELGPGSVIQEVLDSKLVGRGGAAFPTGRKWEAVAKAPARPHYVVCYADESEPGTFKDRILMEDDPFAIIEGMTIAAYATGSERGFIYIRGEYPLAIERITLAVASARQAGFLGGNILGSGFLFDI